jgi:pimeloyl-ACP methyl ester carboxylesterase
MTSPVIVVTMTRATIPGFSDGDAVVNGATLHYRLGGDLAGPPVFLQHGWAGTGYTWRHVAPLLAEAGCAVLVPDLRGYGDSDKPSGVAGYDGKSLAEDARGLVRELEFGKRQPIVVAAHDMGAPGALLWADANPEKVAALLYIEEPVFRPQILQDLIVYSEDAAATGSMWWWLLALAPNAPEQIIVGREREYLTWFYNRFPDSAAATADAVDEYLRTFRDVEGVLGALGVYRAALQTARQTEELVDRPVRVPVTGVGGSHSRADTVARWLEDVCDNVTPIVMDGGHFLPEEQPAQIAALILRSRTETTSA